MRKLTEFVVMGLIVFGVVGYGITSILYTGARVSEAEGTLNAVVAHQNSLNATFSDIDTQVSTLDGTGKFDPAEAQSLVDLSIENSALATRTINEDDQALVAAATDLRVAPMLDMFGRAGIDREAQRIAHARAALAAARTLAADQELDGQFWRALYASLADFVAYSATSSSATLLNASHELDYAAQMAAYAPGLPDDLRSLLSDLRAFVADATRDASVSADLNRIAAYNLDTIGGEIHDYYQPLIDSYNSEISAATAQ